MNSSASLSSLPFVLRPQQLAKAGTERKRLLQVVRRNMGELRKLSLACWIGG